MFARYDDRSCRVEWSRAIDVEQRLVLKPHVTEGDVVSLAMRSRWMMTILGNRKADVFMNRWVNDEGTQIDYAQDPLTSLSLILLRGEESDRLAAHLRNEWDCYTLADALLDLDHATDRDARLRAIYAVALTAPPEQDDRLVEIFRRIADDADPGLRQSVVVVTGYLPWPALRDVVRGLQENDPIGHVRKNAKVLLEGIRR